jgi:dTDP-4-dehydrorhamnose reductase
MAAILVTGASGQLGSELKVVSENFRGYEFIFTDTDELDITDYEKVKQFIKSSSPDWLINCAAYNLVDKAEDEPATATLVNSTGVRNIVDAVKGSECHLIQFSTDYVFNGRSNVPYNETCPAEPINAYGISKLSGEKEALLHHGSMVIRTSWLYSTFGNNFVKTIISKGKGKDRLKVVFDQTGSPTYAADLASAIMNIVARVIRNQVAFNAGIYHYSNEGVCSWFDFATEIISETGINCRVLPVLSDEYPSVARRPFYSVLNKSKIKETYNLEIPHWRESLKKCIKLLK